jgi:D-alanyl-D-alanine carboxypeptidase/D-alanyl-D-alanine-endopeptidase (penicillin-binding protein 4)
VAETRSYTNFTVIYFGFKDVNMFIIFRPPGYISFIKLIFLLSFIITGCSTSGKITNIPEPQSNLKNLQDKLSYIISDPNLFNAQIGLYIESIDIGETIFAHNEHKLFISASNMKIFTTATALLRFGPGFTYKTNIYYTNSVENGVLQGDLIIKGSGDPTIAPRFSNGDSRAYFRSWADSLIAKGITKIEGNIVGDESYFTTDRLGFGWQWDDEPFWYSAQISALTFNDNCVDVTIIAGDKIGNSPEVSLSPQTNYVSIENKAVTTKADSVRTLFITRPRLQNKILIRNEFPINKPKMTRSISVEDPARFFIHVLCEVLEDKGIDLSGDLKIEKNPGQIDYSNHSLLFTHQSPPLSEIIEVVNKRSQNLYTEQLLVTIAAEYGKDASAAEGIEVVNNTLVRMGISKNEFSMRDGSGLSRFNLISPHTVSLLLRYMSNHNYFPYVYNSLPSAGVDGTLRSRMKNSPAEGYVRAKTGTVGHVRNLSGYVESRSGEIFLFSFLVNNYLLPTQSINNLQDRIGNLLATFER